MYDKYQNLMYSLFSNKSLVIRTGFQKVLVRIANREDHDQTDRLEAVWYGSELFI